MYRHTSMFLALSFYVFLALPVYRMSGNRIYRFRYFFFHFSHHSFVIILPVNCRFFKENEKIYQVFTVLRITVIVHLSGVSVTCKSWELCSRDTSFCRRHCPEEYWRVRTVALYVIGFSVLSDCRTDATSNQIFLE